MEDIFDLETLKNLYLSLINVSQQLITLDNMWRNLEKFVVEYNREDANTHYRRDLLEDIYSDLVNCKIKEYEANRKFCSCFNGIYNSSCQVNNGVISLVNFQSLVDYYEGYILNSLKLLENNEFKRRHWKKLKYTYEKLMSLISILEENLNFVNLQIKYNSLDLKEARIRLDFVISVLKGFIKQFEDIIKTASYEYDILNLKEKEENTYERLLDGTIKKHILDNSFLVALIFANNGENKILNPFSVNKKFLCQFHDEKTASMKVYTAKNHFYCFGCGKHGNQAEYLMQYESISYNRALYLLAEIFLIELPENPYRDSKIALKYRNSFTSDSFIDLILKSCDKYKNNDRNRLIFDKIVNSIRRVKEGIVDKSLYINEDKKFNIEIKNNSQKRGKS